jgi:cobalt/nickel transport system permease protein
MTLVHAAIGLGEAVITGLVVRYILVRRPDLFEWHHVVDGESSGALRWGQTIMGGLAIAVAVAVFLGPFASEQPDGLEFVGEKLGFLKDSPAQAPVLNYSGPMADYQVRGLDHVRLATALAGLIGTLAVFALGWLMSRILSKSIPTSKESILTSKEATPDAA